MKSLHIISRCSMCFMEGVECANVIGMCTCEETGRRGGEYLVAVAG